MDVEKRTDWGRLREIFGCVSGLSVLVTVALTAILYVFNLGKSLIYSIPVHEWSLSIHQFLPVFCMLLGLCAFIIIITIVAKNKVIVLVVAELLDIVMWVILFVLKVPINKDITMVIVIILAFAMLSCLISALINNKMFIPNTFVVTTDDGGNTYAKIEEAEKKNDEKKRKKRRRWLIASALITIFVLISAGISGYFSSKMMRRYQTYISDNNKLYVVIVDLADDVISQRAEVDGDMLKIVINEYTYHSKEGKSFTYTKYGEVGFQKKPHEEPVVLYPRK